MTTFTPLKIVLLVTAGLVGAIVGALTGAFFGIFGWKGIGPTVVTASVGTIVSIVVVNRASLQQRIRLIIGLVLGAIFGVAWAQLSGGSTAAMFGQAANWATYGAAISFVTREALLKVQRWAKWGATVGLILGVAFALFNIPVSAGTAISLQPHHSISEAVGAIVITAVFITFWATVIGLQHNVSTNGEPSPTDQASEITPRRLRPIRKVVR